MNEANGSGGAGAAGGTQAGAAGAAGAGNVQAGTSGTAAGTQAGASGTPPSWRESLAPEFKDHASIKDYPDINTLVKSHVSLQSKLGANPIVRPKDDAKPEEWSSFYESLGRPKTAADYKLPEFKMPEGLPENKAEQEAFRQHFHEAGLTQKQADFLTQKYLEGGTKQFEAFNQAKVLAKAEGIKTLQAEWGKEYDNKVESAKALIRNHGSPQLMEWLDDTGHGDDQAFIRVFADLANKMGEAKATGSGSGALGANSPEAGASEKKALLEDASFMEAWNKQDHPKHAEAVAKWTAVHEKIAGKTKVQPM